MLDRSWTLLDSRQIAQYPILRLREDRYRFEPTGAESCFIVCDTADWALIIATTADGQLVLVRQYRHGVQEVVLEVPGGVLDHGESPEDAARRELREETGYEAGRVRYLGKMLPNPAINNARLHVVLAEDCRWAGAPQFDPFEQIDVVLRPVADVPRMIAAGEIAHALVIASFALWDSVRRGEQGEQH
ncbi:MAG: NUDIX hydrolase [Pirellulales bacterium]|nr:NUDIX hydrolase [Pirellulales bacterium]